MKTLILASLLLAAAASAQTIDSTIIRFEKDRAAVIEKISIKWFVDSVSIEEKIRVARVKTMDPDSYLAFSDLSREEFVSKAADEVAAGLREMAFYRNERNEKMRKAFKAYTGQK